MCIAEAIGMASEEKDRKVSGCIRVLSLEVSLVGCWVFVSL